MDDCVKRDIALQHLKHRLYETAENNLGYICVAGDVFAEAARRLEETWINEIPTADVKPIIRGEWIEEIIKDAYGDIILYKCSICGHLRPRREKFCNWCGAEMKNTEFPEEDKI